MVTECKYTKRQHNQVLVNLKEQFKGSSIDEDFRYFNTIITVTVVKTDFCTLKLTLDFSVEETCEECGSIVCIYGTLSQVRSIVSHNTESWDEAISIFEKLVETLDYSDLNAVKRQFNALWLNRDNTIFVLFLAYYIN